MSGRLTLSQSSHCLPCRLPMRRMKHVPRSSIPSKYAQSTACKHMHTAKSTSSFTVFPLVLFQTNKFAMFPYDGTRQSILIMGEHLFEVLAWALVYWKQCYLHSPLHTWTCQGGRISPTLPDICVVAAPLQVNTVCTDCFCCPKG